MPLLCKPQGANLAPTSSADNSPEVPKFTECPRKTFESGHTAWYQIQSPTPLVDFDICPDCYNTSIAPTRYAQLCCPAPPKEAELSCRCDFADFWIRIGYAWLYATKSQDLGLLGAIAKLQAEAEQRSTNGLEGRCPNLDLENEEVVSGGKKAETRVYYCLTDPKDNTLIEDLTVCSDCVGHIELIMPGLKGIFTAAEGGQKVLATCDLISLGDWKQRGLDYLDQIITVAAETLEKGTRDVTTLTEYVKKWARVPLCKPFDDVKGEDCYVLHAVPEWTACEQCYLTHVDPLLSSTTPLTIAHQIERTKRPITKGFKCTLYSPRLQEYFSDTVSSNDVPAFRQKLLARSHKLAETKMKLERLRSQHAQLRNQIEGYQQMAMLSQQAAMNATLASGITGYWKTPDFGASQAQMASGAQVAMQADMVAADIKLLEKEWTEAWE